MVRSNHRCYRLLVFKLDKAHVTTGTRPKYAHLSHRLQKTHFGSEHRVQMCLKVTRPQASISLKIEFTSSAVEAEPLFLTHNIKLSLPTIATLMCITCVVMFRISGFVYGNTTKTVNEQLEGFLRTRLFQQIMLIVTLINLKL